MNIEPVIFMFAAFVVAPLSMLFTIGTFAALVIYKNTIPSNKNSSK